MKLIKGYNQGLMICGYWFIKATETMLPLLDNTKIAFSVHVLSDLYQQVCVCHLAAV